MKSELAIVQIFNDFTTKVTLTDEELKILKMYIKNYSYIKIANEMGMSDRNVGRIMSCIKEKYENYKKLELAKLKIFMS